MTFNPDDIIKNAQNRLGSCKRCPAQADTQGQFVNPGLIDLDADVMFLTMDPSHRTDWTRYSSWNEYNEDTASQFINKWPGGTALKKLLRGIENVSITDIWLADAVKCPVNNDLAGAVDSDEAFSHCSAYLREEIATVDPTVIVTMGNDPTEQLLNGVYGLNVGSIRAGTAHAGNRYDVDPPVVVSPHWANGWLGRHNNREKVRSAIRETLGGKR